MEIQSQTTTPVNTANSGSSVTMTPTGGNAVAAGTNLSGGQTTDGGFSAALNGMLTATPEATAPATATAQISLAGLNALVQMLTSLSVDTAATTPEQTVKGSVKQLDTLLDMLNSQSENVNVDALLENPDVQAWLAELQTFLQVLPRLSTELKAVDSSEETGQIEVSNTGSITAGVSTTKAVDAQQTTSNELLQQTAPLNPLLFVPMSTGTTNVLNEPITKAEATKLLESFKQLIQSTSDKPVAQQAEKMIQTMMADLQKVLVPFAQVVKADQTQTAKNSETTNELPLLTSKSAVSRGVVNSSHTAQHVVQKSNGNEMSFQAVLTNSNSQLEYLAAKSIQPKLVASESMVDGPLFEPLTEPLAESTGDNPVIPMHQFLKQLENGQQIVKAPVVMVQTPEFVEDMTQLVIKSFTLDTKLNGMTEAKLSLYPQHLGQVDVKLTMHNGQLIAQFMADSSVGKEMLESQLSNLRSSLQSQGIQVEKLEVSQSQSFQSGMFQEQRQQQSNKQQKGNSSDKILSLDEELDKELSRSTFAQTSNGAGSIDTTA